MVEEPEQYNLTAIRRVLLRAFNTDDLDDLFYFAKTADLRAVRNEYVPSDSLRTKIRKAIDYCERRGLLDQLLAEIEEERPEQAEILRVALQKAQQDRREAEERARREAEAREQADRLEAERLEQERQQAEATERLNAQLEELYQQATAMLERRDWAGGRKRLAQIEELEPGYRDVPKSLHEVDVQLARAGQVDGLMAQGLEHLAEGKWWLASDSFRQVLVLAPDHAGAQVRLAEADRQEEIAGSLVKGQNYFWAGRWQEAIASFEAVLEINPGHRDACKFLEEAKAQERARLREESRQAREAREARIKETSRQQDRQPAEGTAGAKAPQSGFDRSRRTSDASAEGVAARPATPEDLQDPSSGDSSFSDFFGRLFDGATGAKEPATGRSAAPAKSAQWRVVKTLKGHTGKVRRAAFSPDGKWVVTASEDKAARVWEVATGRTVVELRGHEEGVNSAAFSPDGTLVATAAGDGRARVWQAVTGQMVAETKKHGTWLGMGWKAVIDAVFFPDGSAVATTASDGKMRIWEPSSGKLKGELEGQEAFAVRAYCSPGVHGLLVEHKDGWGRIPRDIKTDKLWNALRQAQMGKFAAALSEASLLAVPEPSFSADGKRAITAHDDGVARVWEVASGTLVRELPVSKDNPVRAVAFHPGGLWVATVAATETEKVLTADATGRWVATPSGRETVKVWNVDMGSVVRELGGHLMSVNSVGFSLDGKWAVTASDDYTAIVWQVPAS